ncbi:MAG: arylesterase [Stomatobaculum sp.]|nr:arylesterase [Stomatobaculum sp.]
METGEKRTIIFFGDSNTYGYDPRDMFGGRYSENRIWTSLTAAALGGRWNVVNEGMNGREIPAGQRELRYVDSLLRRLRGQDIFAVMLGTNDIFLTSDPDADRAAEKMEQFLQYLLREEKYPLIQGEKHPRIWLIAPPYAAAQLSRHPMYAVFAREHDLMNQEFRRLAEKYGVLFADASEWGIGMGSDLVHFSEEGHRTFAEHVIRFLAAKE